VTDITCMQCIAAVTDVMLCAMRCCVYVQLQHRDLKLENILYEHKGPDAGIKVRTTINTALLYNI
jgi:hypothetical protein